jgi:hypothetical protein
MESMMDKNRHEVHIIQFPAGHKLSTDCFCEPSNIYWTKDPTGNPVLMVIHRDDCPHHHTTILAQRDKEKDWITKMLDSVRPLPPTLFFGPGKE